MSNKSGKNAMGTRQGAKVSASRRKAAALAEQKAKERIARREMKEAMRASAEARKVPENVGRVYTTAAHTGAAGSMQKVSHSEAAARRAAATAAAKRHADAMDKRMGRRPLKVGTHRKLKLFTAIAVALALMASGLGIGLMFRPGEGFVVNEGYGSVSYVVQEGETFSPDKGYSGLDVFGRLNWTFQQKTEWYSSYQGYVYTTVNQDVKTYKQFKDGRLISADITTSSLVNAARQFCYIPSQDRVIWREAAGGPSTYNGFDTPWEQGAPRGNMTISGPDGFKAKNGLPATELSVYVFREETILSSDPAVDNGDGTYTITYHMNPAVWQAEDGSTEGAPAYYSNQMKFTGGLTDVPTFEDIEISFTFNENWENLKTEAHEKYTATMGFTVGCEAEGVTEFSYDTPYLPISNAYEEYFQQYAQMEATGAPDPTIDGMSALASAFAPVISGPCTLRVDLAVGGKPVEGIIYVDLHTGGGVPSFATEEDITNFIDNLEVRAKFGNVRLQVDPAVKQTDAATGEVTVVTPAAAYISVGDDLKLKLTISELMDLLGGLIGGDTETAEPPAETVPAETPEEEASNPLSAIMDAELVHEDGSGVANAHAELDLGGLLLPIDFNYFIDEEKLTASLNNVHTAFTVADISVEATLGYTQADKAPAPISDKDGYVELAGHVKNILALVQSGDLHVELAYEGYGLTVTGGVDITYPTSADGELTDEQKQERIKASALLTIKRGEASKTVRIAYENGVAYIDLDGVKISASVNEAADLVKKFLAKDEDKDNADGATDQDTAADEGFSIPKLVDTLLFTTLLTDNIKVSGNADALTAAVNVTALIKAFGFDLGSFDLSDLTLGVAGESISVASEKLGASLKVTKGTGVTVEKDGYTDLMGFVNAVTAITESGFIGANVDYNKNGLQVSGTVKLDINHLAAVGEITLTYQKLVKTIQIAYLGGEGKELCLTIDGLKLKVYASDAIDIVKSLIAEEDPDAAEDDTVEKILDAVFSFRFGDVLSLSDADDTLSLTLNGTALLEAFGVKFGLGTVVLTLGDTIEATAEDLGLSLTLAKGDELGTLPDPDEFTDLTPVLKELPAILNAETLSLEGEVVVRLGKAEPGVTQTEISLAVQKGYISWKDGIDVYLDLILGVGDVQQNILLRITDAEVQLYYSGIGVQLYYKDLSQLETALLDVYGRVRGIVQDALGADAKNPLPELTGFEDLMDLLQGSAVLAEATEETVEEGKDFDWTELVGSIVIGASAEEGGIAHLEYKGLTVEILSELAAKGLIGLKLGFTAQSVTVNGALHAAVYTGEIPEMPAIEYLGTEEIADLIDYLGAAVGLISQKNLTLTLTGTVTSTDEKYADYGYVKSNIEATIEYKAGENFPLYLDVDGKHLVVDPDVYLHVSFAMTSPHPDDSNMELDITVVDADKEVKQDDILDFYITASTIGKADTANADYYDPLKLYAPADEVMTILSGVCAMFGVDVDILNDYMIGKWLTAENVGELKGLGDSLKSMLADISGVGPILEQIEGVIGTLNGLKENGLGGLTGLFGKKDEPAAAELEISEGQDAPDGQTPEGQDTSVGQPEESAPAKKGGYITALELSKATKEQAGKFTFSLDGAALFGEGCDDLTVTLQKAMGEDGSTLLTSLSINNIYGKKGTEKTDIALNIGTAEVTAQAPAIEGYFNVEAVDTLILALAKSATHGVNEDGTVYTGEETPHHYVLNNNFYIDGSATLDLLSGAAKITIKVIAISVNLDEDGRVGINLRLEYDGYHNLLGGVLGDSDIIKGDTALDVTIKESPRSGEGLMLYMKRTQTTEFDGSKELTLPEPYVIYRALPLSNFMKDYMNHICFMFNLSEKVITNVMEMVGTSGSSGGAADNTPTDLGAYLDKFVKSCTYNKAEVGDTWTLNINGQGLTGSDTFKKMQVAVTTDAVGYLRGIAADLDIAGAVTIHADLTWHNPGGKMDADSKDTTTDVAATLEDAMDIKLENADWETTNCIEGQLGSIKYFVKGKLVNEQHIVYDTQTKEFYSELKYPSFDGAEAAGAGYHWEWPKNLKLKPIMEINASEVPNTYTFLFKSDYDVEGDRFENSEGKFVKTDEYTYGASYDLRIGTQVRGDDYVKELVGYQYAGQVITDLTKWKPIDDATTVELIAVWKDVEFTVTFDVNGEITERKGIFGAEIKLPEGYETAKEGYSFAEWDSNVPKTFSPEVDNAKYTAQYEPKQFEITFVSEHFIEWDGLTFTMCNEGEHSGKYVATYMFTYDKPFKLPINAKAENGGFILSGWKSDKTYKDNLPNVLEPTTFTAVWEKRGVYVYFGDENGNIFKQFEGRNKQVGSTLTDEDIPDEVPERFGYTGEWNIAPDYTVPESGDGEDGKIVIRAKYTPITFEIDQYSLYPLDGFTKVEKSESVTGTEYYVRKLFYVYDSNKVTLEGGGDAVDVQGAHKKGFEYKGFFSEPLGEGKSIETINNDTITGVFGWTGGAEVKFSIYAYWKSNAITVRFYSDIQTSDLDLYASGKGFYYDEIYLDDDTQITFKPTADGGYQHLAWFVEDSAVEGGWRLVTDVLEFRVTKGKNAYEDEEKDYDVELYAVWIEEIKLNIASVSREGNDFAATYSISGTAKGGLPHGAFSEKIYTAAGVKQNIKGIYILGGKKGDETLKSGKDFTLTPRNDGSNTSEFSDTGMTTAKYGFLSSGAAHGGAAVELTFTDRDEKAKVVVHDVAVITIGTYTVNFKNQEGTVVGSVPDIHLNYTGSFNSSFFDGKLTFDGTITSSSHVYADELAASNGIDCPQTDEEGKVYIWPHKEVTSSELDISPVYVTELQNVTFRSDVKLDDRWVEEYEDGEPTGKYVFKTQLYLESKVYYRDYNGLIRTDIVEAGDNLFDLPTGGDIYSIGNRKGEWKSTSYYYDPYGFTFTAEYGEDTIVYYSEIPFKIEKGDGDFSIYNAKTEYPENYQGSYTPWTPVADGYTFLGWYTKDANGKWSKVSDTLDLAAAETTTRVEALWVTETNEGLSTTLKTVRTVDSKWWGENRWRYESTLQIEGDGLLFIGTMVAELSLNRTISVEHYVAKDNEKDKLSITNDPTISQANGIIEYKWDQTWERDSAFGADCKRQHGYAVITFTYHIDGLDDITFTVKVSDMNVAD